MVIFCPPAHKCQVCLRQGHWIVECSIVRNDRRRYAHIDLEEGCLFCGSAAHDMQQCPAKRRVCNACGDLHATNLCPFNRKTMSWHEFYDERTKSRFYQNTATQEVTWEEPLAMDTVLWCCDPCNHLLPSNVSECPQCHAKRRTTVVQD